MTGPSSRSRGVHWLCCAALLQVHCFAHTSYVRLVETRASSATTEETESISSAIGRRIEPLGMIRHPRIDHVREIHRTSHEVDFLVVDEWVDQKAGYVEVFIKQNKRDGAVAVVIRDRTWPRATDLTDQLEAEVRDALSEAYPQREVVIEHRTEGPSFSP